MQRSACDTFHPSAQDMADISADSGPRRPAPPAADHLPKAKLKPAAAAGASCASGDGGAGGGGRARVSETSDKGKQRAETGPPAEVRAAAEGALQRALSKATETGALPIGVRIPATAFRCPSA